MVFLDPLLTERKEIDSSTTLLKQWKMLKRGAKSMSGKQIKVIFLVDDFVFETIESAKKFIADSAFESAEKEPNPSYKGRDI